MRRRNGGIGHLEVQQIVEVFKAQSADLTGVFCGEFRIKSDISSARVVIELAVDRQFGLRPDIFEKQALTPTVVRNDQVWVQALGPDAQRCTKTGLCTNGFGLKIADPRVDLGCGAACGGVRCQPDPLPLFGLGFLHGHGHHSVALLNQRWGQKLELAGEVLVNKKNLHAQTGVCTGATCTKSNFHSHIRQRTPTGVATPAATNNSFTVWLPFFSSKLSKAMIVSGGSKLASKA